MKLESMNLNSCQQIPMKEPEFVPGLVTSNCISKIIVSQEEAQEKACEELRERLQVLEEGTKNNVTEGNRKIHGEDPDVLDIILVATLYAFKAQEEVLGQKILDPEKSPLIFSWVTTLLGQTVVKEVIPPHENLVS